MQAINAPGALNLSTRNGPMSKLERRRKKLSPGPNISPSCLMDTRVDIMPVLSSSDVTLPISAKIRASPPAPNPLTNRLPNKNHFEIPMKYIAFPAISHRVQRISSSLGLRNTSAHLPITGENKSAEKLKADKTNPRKYGRAWKSFFK